MANNDSFKEFLTTASGLASIVLPSVAAFQRRFLNIFPLRPDLANEGMLLTLVFSFMAILYVESFYTTERLQRPGGLTYTARRSLYSAIAGFTLLVLYLAFLKWASSEPLKGWWEWAVERTISSLYAAIWVCLTTALALMAASRRGREIRTCPQGHKLKTTSWTHCPFDGLPLT